MDTPTAMRIQRDLAYGTARIGYAGGAGPMRSVTLAYDAYLPDPAPGRPAPALILAFGGAFHRGSKEDDAFAGTGGSSTAMAAYCARFARAGFACFSVDYRLVPMDPEPSSPPVLTRPEAVPTGRVAEVRRVMGLPPIAPTGLAQAMEAAIADVAAAATTIRSRAAEHGVDPDRIVLGGWSAGARCALYAAYALRVPCAGVIALSGTMLPEDLEAHLRPGDPLPPALVVAAERDLDYVRTGAAPLVEALRQAGAEAKLVEVPGHDHWYPAEAVTDAGTTVEAALREALRDWTGA